MLRFGVRSMFSAFGIVEHLQVDQLFTGLLLSASQFGLYAAGTAFANLPRFLGQSVGYVAYPEVSVTGRTEKEALGLLLEAVGKYLKTHAERP